MISARDDKTRVSAPAEGSLNRIVLGGQVLKYSPPVPSLHTGAIRPFLYASIFASLLSENSMIISFVLCPIDHTPPETQTKTEQNGPGAKTF